MKVVHLVPAMEQGGVETVVCDLTRALCEAGHESVVVSRGGRLVSRIEGAGGRHRILDLKSKNPLTGLFRARALRRLLREERPDLVCAHSRVPAWLFVLANRSLRLPWITHAHGANSVSAYSRVMTFGDLTVTPSRFLADYLKANYGIAEDRLRIVPNCVDAARFDPSKLDEAFVAEMRRTWGILPGDRVTMTVGRITKVKGYESLIAEFGRTAAPNDKLVIVGGADRHHQDYLARLKATAGPNVVFAGAQSKIPECLSIADEVVSANTTKPESFGLSVIEAYAMNRPVRARRFGGVAEIMSAVESSGAQSTREAVLDLYGFPRFAARMLAVYREIAARTGGRPS